MKAWEAKQVAAGIDTVTPKVEMLLKLIRHAAERGETELTEYGLLDKKVKQRLVDMGYEVTEVYPFATIASLAPSNTRISWEHARPESASS